VVTAPGATATRAHSGGVCTWPLHTVQVEGREPSGTVRELRTRVWATRERIQLTATVFPVFPGPATTRNGSLPHELTAVHDTTIITTMVLLVGLFGSLHRIS